MGFLSLPRLLAYATSIPRASETRMGNGELQSRQREN